MDNVFVFVVIFAFFGVPLKYQYRVLFWGIFGRDRDAAHVYLGGRPADRSIRMDVLHLRRVSDLHGHQTGQGARREAHPDQNIVLRFARKYLRVARDRTATISLSVRTASCSSRRCSWCCW